MSATRAAEALFPPGRDFRQQITDYIMDEGNEFRYLFNRYPTVWIQKTIMPHLHKSGWQYMLEKPSDKFHGIKGHGFPFLLDTILIEKSDLMIIKAFDPAIGDRHPKHMR